MPSLRTILVTVCLSALSALATSCGGGGGGDGSSGGSGTTTLIAGTGIGTITGFGSVILNDDRRFEFDDDTEFEIDGKEVTEGDLRGRGRGMRVRVLVRNDVSDDFTSGTAASVKAENELKGPVTSIGPLQVLGQTVIVTADTVLVNLSSASLLVKGDHVEVSGFRTDRNAVQATRLEFVSAGLTEWKLTGFVTGVTPADLAIGPQIVSIAGVAPRDCPVDELTGKLVEIVAAASPSLDPGGRLLGVTEIACKERGLPVPDGAPREMRAEVEGLITEIEKLLYPEARFKVNGQTVETTVDTLYRNGAFADILPGARLEAEGRLDTTTGVLTARRVAFRGNRVRIRAAPTAVDTSAATMTFFNRITVRVTDLSRFESETVGSLGDVTANSTGLEVEGFVDGSGTVFANKVGDDDGPEGVELRGPVGPDPQDPLFTLLGVTVITADTEDFQIGDSGASREEFFARIGTEGTQARVTGDFDGNLIQARKAEVEE